MISLNHQIHPFIKSYITVKSLNDHSGCRVLIGQEWDRSRALIIFQEFKREVQR